MAAAEEQQSPSTHTSAWREIGSQGQCQSLHGDRDPEGAAAFGQCWQLDTEAWLRSAAKELRDHGRIAMLIGDGAGVNVLTSVTAAASRITREWEGDDEGYGLTVVASASVDESATRPWRGRRRRAYRREHAILVEKTNNIPTLTENQVGPLNPSATACPRGPVHVPYF